MKTKPKVKVDDSYRLPDEVAQKLASILANLPIEGILYVHSALTQHLVDEGFTFKFGE